MIKTHTIALAAAFLFASGITPCSAQLRVDFNSTNQDGGPHNLAGFQSYQASHEVGADFTAARSYTAFGTTVALTASYPDTTANTTKQMVDRSDTSWLGAWPDLLTDWIGVDTRTTEGGRGAYDGATGLPTRLVLKLGGLPAGTYTWRSYHHDTNNQNMNFAVQLSTNGGTSYSSIGTYKMTSSASQTGSTDPDPRNLPSTVTFPITATAGQDVLVRFVPYSLSTDIAQAIFACNGVELFAPANPPPGPTLIPGPQPAGSYSIDFGTAGSPVQPGFAGVLGAHASTVTINGTTFELREGSTPPNLLSAFRPAVTSPLLSDFVYNPAGHTVAGIVLRVTGLSAGEYTLESWHHDPDLTTGAIQIEKRPVGGSSTVLIDQFAFGVTAATTAFTSDGTPFEIVVRNDSPQNVNRWNGVRITSGAGVSPVRPHSPWVFRTLMENRTRMLVAALHPNLWVSFNPGNCCIDRAWTGGMRFFGKVFDDSQKNSWINGPLYHRYPNSIFEATDEAAFPAGWTVNTGSVDYTSATQGTSYINSLRDKRVNRWYKFNGTTTVTTATYDLSRYRETILFFEERQSVGTNWNLLPGSGTLRVQVSEDNGATWTWQDFFSTEANLANQFNFKEITSRSPTARLRFTSQGGQFANITLEGEYQGWTAANAQGAVSVTPNWRGYRTLNRDEAVTLRYELRLAGGASVAIEETPEALPQISGPPRLERKFAATGIPAGTTVSLRLGGDPAWSTYTESWTRSGAGALRTTGGVTYLDLTADGTATVTASWTP